MPSSSDGILNLNKPSGLTSHDVVAAVRRMSDQTRVGHAGTLDPMATGVLLICLGQATRVSEYLADHDKRYHAGIRLGIETDTYDAAGRIISEQPVAVTPAQLEDALRGLTGKIVQRPPSYSAIKQNGVPLYKLARQGIHVEAEPRQVEIYSITITQVALPELELDIYCSKGTYIRSLAHDLGAILNCGGHLTKLVRTNIGQFRLEDSVTLDQLTDAFRQGFAERLMSPLDEALLQFEAVIVEAEMAKRIQQGNPLVCERSYSTPLIRAYSTGGELIALLEHGQVSGMWKPKKVFLG